MPVTVNDVPAPPVVPSSQQTDGRSYGRAREGADRCPGVLRPHEAADGLLARVRLVGGRVDAAAWGALAAGARLGNGIVELTSRGNVQVRGLRADGLDELAVRLRAAGVLRSVAHDRVRNIVCEPLAGRRGGAVTGAADVDAVLAALDDGLCADGALAALPGRFLFCVDDGGGGDDGVEADVRLVARPGGGWSVVVGDAVGLVVDDGAQAVAVALDVTRTFLRARAGAGTGAWRIAELPGGADGLVALLPPAVASNVRRSVPWSGRTDVPRVGEGAGLVGPVAQRDGRVAVGALAPLGRVDATALDLLADVAARAEVRVWVRRTVTVLDVEPGDAPELLRALAATGLVVDPGSGWDGLTACAGTGACAAALADARAGAAARAAQRSPGDPREHWSACGRRCGQTADVARAVCARADGTWDVTEVAR